MLKIYLQRPTMRICYTDLSHFAKCLDLWVKLLCNCQNRGGGQPIWAMPVFRPFLLKGFPYLASFCGCVPVDLADRSGALQAHSWQGVGHETSSKYESKRSHSWQGVGHETSSKYESKRSHSWQGVGHETSSKYESSRAESIMHHPSTSPDRVFSYREVMKRHPSTIKKESFLKEQRAWHIIQVRFKKETLWTDHQTSSK